MKSRSLFVLGVGVTALSLFAVACGDDDDPAPANNTPSKGGSAGSSAGSAGAAGSAAGAAGSTAAGSAGATAGGSAGATAGGSAGATAGGSAGATAGGSAGATAGGSAGATAGGSAGAASGKKFGLVSVTQTVSEFVPGTKSISTVGIASFQGTTSSGSSSTTCKNSTEGACNIVECETAAGGAGGAGGAAGAGGAPAGPAFLSAGDITITGLKAEVKLVFKDAASGYAAAIGTASLWDGGETGKFAAVGTADIPAFNGEATAPAAVVFSKPAAVALGGKIPVDSAAAFELAWDADAKAKINVGLTTSSADTKKTTIVNCSFDGAAKTASVPAAVTAKLQKGGTAVISIGTGNTKIVSAGDFDVNLTLTNSVISGQAEVK